jgi:PPOX class probable F420-dependent enzyme
VIEEGIRTVLEGAQVARLATATAAGQPHAVPICFAFDGRNVYTAIDRKPKISAPGELARIRHIRENPNVALLVDEYDADWSRLWYVLVRGHAELLNEGHAEERRRALGLLRAKYPQYASGMLPDDALVIRITPSKISAWGRPGTPSPQTSP